MRDRTFTIGEAASRAGVSADTIRYYERLGVLKPAPRSANGYRYYSEAVVDRVLFIRTAIQFGFRVKQLAGFLKRCDSGHPPCGAVRADGARLLNEMDRRLAELTATRAVMAETLARWDDQLAHTPAGSPAYLLWTAASMRKPQ
jgi:MerR family transcriptional regulator, copper efflux regulator